MTPDGPTERFGLGPLDAARMLHPGDVLAGRYRIEDLIGEVSGTRGWRASDQVLNRSVGVQELPATDPRAAAFLDAARASTAVTDPRFLRVLDVAVDEDGRAYVVSEWARGAPLADLLAEGPMSNRRAAALVGEVAAAVQAAHEVGRTHRRLSPRTILVKDSEAVRIRGLGTEYALSASAEPEPDPSAGGPDGGGLGDFGLAPRTPVAAVEAAEQEDVQALGRLLYACLVARWPSRGGDAAAASGLPAAPSKHGQLLRPRQVRAGVSREADTVCDRVLGRPPRHHRPPLRSAKDVAEALALVGDDPTTLYDSQPSLTGTGDPLGVAGAVGGVGAEPPTPALLPDSRPPRRVSAEPPAGRGAHRPPSSGARTWVVLAVLLLLALTAFTAYSVSQGTTIGAPEPEPTTAPPSSEPSTSSSPPVEAAKLPVAAVTSFDPQGDDRSEHEDEAPAATDGSLETSWTTVEYYDDPQMAGKQGVGLLLDLGRQREVTSVVVQLGAEPTTFGLFAAPEGVDAAPTTLSALDRIGGQQGAGAEASVPFDPPVTTRYVALWLTTLPEQSAGTYVGVVDDVSVLGRTP